MLRSKRLSALALTALLACSYSSGMAQGELYALDKVEYTTDTAKYGQIAMYMQGTTEIAYPRELNARYEGEATATFVRHTVIRGDQVKKGDVLALVTGNVSRAEVEKARLALVRAKEDYQQQLLANDRALSEQQKALHELNDPAQQKKQQLLLEKTKLSGEQYALTAQRSIMQLEKEYERLVKDDQQIQIVAAADGIIKNTSNYVLGDVIDPNTILVTLYDTADVLLRVTSRWGEPPYGSGVTVRLGNGSDMKEYRGMVVASDNMLSSIEKTGDTYVRLDSGASLVQGQQIQLSFPLFSMDHVLLIDRKGLYEDGGKDYVYLLKDGVRQKQYVTAAFATSTQAWILDGLSEGDVVTLQ